MSRDITQCAKGFEPQPSDRSQMLYPLSYARLFSFSEAGEYYLLLKDSETHEIPLNEGL